MQNVDLESLVHTIVSISKQAGQKILEIYGDDFTVDVKEDNSPLTQADLASHHCIVEAIEDLDYSFPIISEESAANIPFETRKQWHSYWLIDPLDGTKEFINRNGEFTVNIALIHDHKPILGVVYVPEQNRSYFAAREMGAFKQENSDTPSRIQVRSAARAKPTVVGSRSHKTGGLSKYLDNLGDHELVSMGSSLKLCLVAEGVADLYPRIGLTSEWDTAAAHCVVEQAGGKVIDLEGNPLLYNTKESFLNPFFLVYGDQSRDWASYVE